MLMQPCIVGIGEILWDVFPDGPRFGGAPANFACSTAELSRGSARVCMVSAVGDDDLGHAALQSLTSHGVDSRCVQINDRETGQVLVELDPHGVARYRFAENSAWDALRMTDDLRTLATSTDAVCFGTLGQRSQCSRDTIQAFVKAVPSSALRVLDVNLREPFYSDELILASLAMANVLKLNDAELPMVARLCGCSGSTSEMMRQLSEQYHLRCVAVTRGTAGAIVVANNAISDLPGITVDVVDTVGAGDAFTAALILGLLGGQEIHEVNRRAIEVASYVCSQAGATPGFPAHFR
jgi:fructokinase